MKERKFYILVNGEPEPTDHLTWGCWLKEHFADKFIRKTQVGDMEVSTVFLGIDHNFSDTGPPILFETMIFQGEYDGRQWRYATQEEAIAHHEELCQRLKDKDLTPMKRDTARALKALDMDLIRAVLVLERLIRDRAKLDQPSTEDLLVEIVKSLTGATYKKEKENPK